MFTVDVKIMPSLVDAVQNVMNPLNIEFSWSFGNIVSRWAN